MVLVRILKNQGFENVGDLVDYRGVDLEEKIASGDMMKYEDELAQQATVEPEPAEEEAPASEPTPETIPSEEKPEEQQSAPEIEGQ